MTRKIHLTFLILILFLLNACSGTGKTASDVQKTDLVSYVDPFIGTDSDGHTFPGAVVPFGMIQLSPDTRIKGNHSASGYHYSDSAIMGFSHTHYSGTGRGSGGDFLLLPVNEKHTLSKNKFSDPKTVYRSSFSHKNETASPGYYKVFLNDGITAELTATKRVGFHKYTYPDEESPGIILDLSHGISDKPDSLYLKIIGKNRIVGMRRSTGGLRDYQTLYFAAEFSQEFDSFTIVADGKTDHQSKQIKGKNIRALFGFGGKKIVMVKLAISKVDIEGAQKNLQEISGWDFERIRSDARQDWNTELGKITVTTRETENYKTFYTALYHSCIMPSLDMDIDGRYRSTNNKIYTAKDFTDYTNFSLWDTFRALHPLMTIINQSKTEDFIKTFIERFEHSGTMPIFELSGNDLLVMIGYHSLPVIADAYVKGIRNYDVEKAVEGMKGLADIPFEERNEYKTFGFIPYNYTDQAVSRSLEFAFDDWSLAQVCKDRDQKAFLHYSNRARFYKNLFNKISGFMHPKDANRKWMTDFDPLAYTRKYTQGNAWQYSTFVLQDLSGLIQLMGGDKKFENWLDRFFTTKNDQTYQRKTSSQMIGQYYHGNEPSHHMAYLYNYCGVPWKTQKMLRKIMESQYNNSPDGLAGNDDAGQLSAWYVLSAMGFYSVTPGMDYYIIGSPLFDRILIRPDNGKTFEIIAKNNSKTNIYIQSVSLNGKPYTKSYLKHNDILNGGVMVFQMGDKPNTSWAVSPEDRPYSNTFNDVAIPQITVNGKTIPRDGVVTFLKKSEVSVSCDTDDAKIFYTMNGTEPNSTSRLYNGKIKIDTSCVLKVKSFKKGKIPGYTSVLEFRKLIPVPAVKTKAVRSGIPYTYREVSICKEVAQIDEYPVLRSGIARKINNNQGFKTALNHAFIYNGYIKVPETGIYTFYADTEYAAALWIDGELIASNESTDWLGERSGTLSLQKGLHKIVLKKLQVGGETNLKLFWEGMGIRKQEVPPTAFFY